VIDTHETDSFENHYQTGLRLEDVETVAPAVALLVVGNLINASSALRRPAGFRHAIIVGERLLACDKLNSARKCLLHSYLANAWSGLRRSQGRWVWASHELSQELLELRRAISHEGFGTLDKEAQCPILTNLGNLLSSIGRVVEALPLWNRALALIPNFGMALANRGEAFISYARALSYSTLRNVFLEAAIEDLSSAMSEKECPVESEAAVYFEQLNRQAMNVLARVPVDHRYRPKHQPLGKTKAERAYRTWCLRHGLFLNPLNDLTAGTPAAIDSLSCPPMIVNLNDAPYFVAMLDQMKQEFVSARFLYYEAIASNEPSFSDSRVSLHDTLDFPAYGLSTEKQKIAFRVTYSLFDKIALFLNAHFDLGIGPERVSFQRVWYKQQNPKKGLEVNFSDRENWPLRGLYWLSRDLFEDGVLADLLEPEAQDLHKIRNYLEHKTLRLTLESGASMQGEVPAGFIKTLGITEFSAKTLKLLRLSRAAMIYLCLSLWREEQVRTKARPKRSLLRAKLNIWKDEWKR
jgi:tetratricopeptide (TPR) repeat protein